MKDGRIHFRASEEQNKFISKKIELGEFKNPSEFLRYLIDKEIANE